MLQLSRALARLDAQRLPYHLTPITEGFIRELAAHQPGVNKLGLKAMLRERLEPVVLAKLFPDKDKARAFHAMLHNTAVPTILRAGDKLNLIPDEATCELDGRILPGQTAESLRKEVLDAIDDPGIELEILSSTPAVSIDDYKGDTWRTLTSVVARHAPEIVCLPYMVTGFTDARAFSQLGTKCYGFSPLKLEPKHNLSFSALFHGIDERVPEEGFTWGQRVLFEAVEALLA